MELRGILLDQKASQPRSITGFGLFVVPIAIVVGFGVAIKTKSASDF